MGGVGMGVGNTISEAAAEKMPRRAEEECARFKLAKVKKD